MKMAWKGEGGGVGSPRNKSGGSYGGNRCHRLPGFITNQAFFEHYVCRHCHFPLSWRLLITLIFHLNVSIMSQISTADEVSSAETAVLYYK